MIHLRDVHKYYAVAQKKLHVLKGIDLQIQEGEMVSIMGDTGSGKSTLLNILGILDDYDQGEYTLAGTSIKHLSQAQAAYFREKFLGFVFQSFDLLSFQNVLENVTMPLIHQQVGHKELDKLALECLDRMGLKEYAHHTPDELSAGQRQRVAIARALISKPKLILADEPTRGLEAQAGSEVMEIFKEVNRQGMTVVMVTQETHIAEQTNRVIRLKDGRILDDGLGNVAEDFLTPVTFTKA
ncbi:macrolide ABC transporter ATP-binding protein [Rufibacter radiotolerans]|uniref:Macrolide ABC transporter ATP-binding protein n=1 Tax=Rufibacter radiotolerans TaxID=1379910 RepID=A0A0H4VNN7_9BACT|nr:ABC transporter ATP-binding protein [Rufibacter radiotolerans]AKQ46923.1 macrolide ABC transporter ATP-binding protein [Rufibacter radiotolerans]